MKKIFLFLKGLLMGACDVIPGVSGGTIAFITGIYDELLDALHAFNLKNIKLLLKGKFRTFWKKIHGNFLLILFGGIILAILTLAKLINFLLIEYPVFVRAFFFGLILASVFILKKTIKKLNTKLLIFLLIGVLVGFGITILPIMTLGTGNDMIFFAGAFAIIAMILPGISGSYILVVLGQYQNVLGKLVDAMSGNLGAVLSVLIFMIGALIGLLFFSKLLHYIKTKRHDQMMIVLIGFMIGSLNKVRPRKKTVETFVDRHGDIQPLIQKNILPTDIKNILLALGLAIVGFLLVFVIEKLAKKLSK